MSGRLITSVSPSTPGKLTFRFPGRRRARDPLTAMSSSAASSCASKRSRKAPVRTASSAISRRAMAQASPNPTMAGTLSVPERKPDSWPPPSICAASATRGARRRRYSAPIPLGPYILCALSDIRSMWSASTSMGILPNACAASQWKKTPRWRQMAPISRTACTTPISLLAYITLTSTVSGRMASPTPAGSSRPSLSGARTVAWQPCFSRWRMVSSTAGCSVAMVTTWLPLARHASTTPLIARLSLSVAPLVKTISRAAAPASSAIRRRAASTAFSASQPNLWVRLAALPNLGPKKGSMASSARGSTGVVAWQSRYTGLCMARTSIVAQCGDRRGMGSCDWAAPWRILVSQSDSCMPKPSATPDTGSIERENPTPMYRVVLLDDNDHTYDYVIEMLQSIFIFSLEQAWRHAEEVDRRGRTVLMACTLAEAEYGRDQIHAYGPDPRLPRSKGSMSAVIEPAL